MDKNQLLDEYNKVKSSSFHFECGNYVVGRSKVRKQDASSSTIETGFNTNLCHKIMKPFICWFREELGSMQCNTGKDLLLICLF